MKYGNANSFAQGAATGLRIMGGMVDLLDRREDKKRTRAREDMRDQAFKDDQDYLKGTTRPNAEKAFGTDQESKKFGLSVAQDKHAEWQADAPVRSGARGKKLAEQDVYGNIINNPLFEESGLAKLTQNVNAGNMSTLNFDKAQKTQEGEIAGTNAENEGKVTNQGVNEGTADSRIEGINAGAKTAVTNSEVAESIKGAAIKTIKAGARGAEAKANVLEDEVNRTRYKLKEGGKVTKAALIKSFEAATRLGKDDEGEAAYIDIETGEPTTFIEWANARLEKPLEEIKNPRKKPGLDESARATLLSFDHSGDK